MAAELVPQPTGEGLGRGRRSEPCDLDAEPASGVCMTPPTAAPPGGLHVVLVTPEIHWNTGNAGRSCLAAGATLHLVEPLGFSLDEREVRRAGLDYWPRVPLRRWANWEAIEAALPGLGEPWFFSAEAERSFWQASFAGPTVLVFGRESDGLPAALRRRHPDRLLRIPMRDAGVRSLNLSTAVALALWEAARQRALAAGEAGD